MSQTSHLINTLKRCLRAKGLTYRDVAAALELSEASVKRIFSEKSFSLQRLEDTCRFLDMTVYDLARLAGAQDDPPPNRLNDEQEAALADDPRLLAHFYLLLVGWKPYRIAKRLSLTVPAQTRNLTLLDRLKLIELMPRNRVRLLTDTHITWRADGPVRRRFEQRVKQEFLHHDFASTDEVLKLESSELSDASIKVLQRRIDRLTEEYFELTEMDRHLHHDQKRSFALLIGARPWTFWNIIEEIADEKR